MKITKLSIPSTLVLSLLAGCVMQPGDEQGELDSDPAAQVGDDDSDDGDVEVLDGRAAVAAETNDLSALTSQTMGLTTWYSGPIAPGDTQQWVWTNSSATAVYQPGTQPIGASALSPCDIEVSRSWDVQKPDGAHRFVFQLKNVGSITCGANILLESAPRHSALPTGGIAPGASKNFIFNKPAWVGPEPKGPGSFFANINPSGATGTNDCKLEVTRTWHVLQPDGKRHFYVTAKNIGAIACQGEINLGLAVMDPPGWISIDVGALNPGASKTQTMSLSPNTIPVLTLWPHGASGLTACKLEITQQFSRQKINGDGTTRLELVYTVKNVGTLACEGDIEVNELR